MKKSVIFALGLAVVAAAAVPFTSASRNAYHAYITSQDNQRQYRYYTDRLGDTRRFRQLSNRDNADTQRGQAYYRGSLYRASRERNSRVTSSRPSALGRDRDTNTTYVEATTRTAVDRPIRTFATRGGIAPWRQNLRGTGRFARMANIELPQSFVSFETFENDAFSVELPADAQATVDDAHTFTAMGGEVSIRIKRFEADTCHKSFGFRGCANNITRGENHALVGGKGRLISLQQVVRQSYKSDTVLDRLNLQTNVYTEEFTAEFPTGGTFTLYRYAAQDVDGGVYFIEVKVPRTLAREYVGVSNRIFDSFRVYPEDATAPEGEETTQ